MQAVNQCAVCASRTTGAAFLRKYPFRSQAACMSLLRSSENVKLSSRKPADGRLSTWMSTVHISRASLSVSHPLSAVAFTEQVENLSHDSLIRRAASLVTDSSSTFLSQTTLAFIDVLTEYSKAVHTLVALQRRYLASLGKLTPAEEDSIWQVIIGQREEVSNRLDRCNRFESTWVNSVKLCKMAAEAANTSGAQQASIAVKTNIQVAQSQVEEAQKLSVDADQKLAETKVEEIQRMAKYVAFLGKNEEYEINEAYLRED
ncbi:diablo homolog, mitochondrial-like [Thalassophryne amazonica]|uniref:diablo homolog, mitochondrial-like n=1 Tax=Thalassophryne amazonica TaxID=390379 RepID=UPI0014711F45|nr:diablo homolog, mitochondrial-like [Thalassophryne amazonica]